MRQIRTNPEWLEQQRPDTDRRQDIRRQWERLLHVARYLDQQERAFLETVVEHRNQGMTGDCKRVRRETRETKGSNEARTKTVCL